MNGPNKPTTSEGDAAQRRSPSAAVAVAGGGAAVAGGGAAAAVAAGPADPVVVRVDGSNVARLGAPKPGPRPRQLLSLPPFPAGADPLPGRKVAPRRVTAVSWVKHYFADVPQEAVQAHFNRRMVTFCTGILPTRCRSVSEGWHALAS